MATLRDYYNTGDDAVRGVKSDTPSNVYVAQTFTPDVGFNISSVKLKLYKGPTYAPGDVTVSITATVAGVPSGAALTSGTTDGDTLTGTSPGEWRTVTLTSYGLTGGTVYALVITTENTGVGGDYPLYWRKDAGGGYADGSGFYYDAAWSAAQTEDFMFELWGSYAVPSDKTYSKGLVAIGNSEVWYESTAGTTMSELAAANAGIDTSLPLTVTEAYQKVFIANETNLKVVDFANTKLTHTALTAAHAKGDILTQATSEAKMVVDHTNTAKTLTYGYVTAGTFNTTNAVTGSGSGTGFTPTAVTNNPHWYDWAVYPGGASGTMPTSAYLVCLYRGRLVLAGHPNYPHQWYMSKISDPWNWVYTSTDPLSAVAGNNTDAGKIGDVIRTLIPYGDDFLIFGCANSIHILDGDPMSGGSIDVLSKTTGIYNWTSWCKDDDGNLYFFGRHGIYIMAGGRSRPVNISKIHLPQLVSDWAIDPTLHRVVMSYDAERRGVLILKTTLADGTCVGYFYSLETEGFYPITLQTTGGVFCSFDYNSDTPADRTLILGCNDGYLRNFLDSAKSDDTGNGDAAISSYVGIVEKITEDDDKEGLLSSLTVEMAGGAGANGTNTFADSDGCSYEYHTANDAETVLEDLKDGATARETGTLTGTGRKSRIRKRLRGAWIALKFYNSTAAETFGINRIFGIISQKGKIK